MRTVRSIVADEMFREATDTPWHLSTGYAAFADSALITLTTMCHNAAAANGWWHTKKYDLITDTETYVLQDRNVGEAIALMHSELSEGFEAARKDLPSDKIEGFSGLEEELADTLIRIFDFAGGANLRLGEAFVAKLKYNTTREDHKLEAREAPGGKKM